MRDLSRRGVIGLVGGAAAWPVAARAQQAVPVVGYLSGRSSNAETALRAPFLKTLEDAGFTIGQNLMIDYRFSEGQDERLPALAAELVQRRVAMLVATDRPSALAAKAATTAIPIVFHSGEDPVRSGLVQSFNRPGGNATGISVFNNHLGPKRLGLLREILPSPGVIALIVNPNSTSTPVQLQEMQEAAQSVAQPLLVLNAGMESEIEDTFATMSREKVAAVVFGASVFFQVIADRLVSLAARHAIPALYEWREFVIAGGLMSYNASRTESGRQIGSYAAQILKGAKPGDLPVVQSSSFEFVLNLKTARSLGITVPPALLASADEVIE
jgi:putative tryptophan/tyrosine transport system substrate-binding protein